ncbi:pilus assembly protein TadG-related protein [Falsibacillus pallidus]|uniref:pilus assembly protein TadG-related protein n=1 Tax=Falsibacillus pallidus TaxID=493781 RepID=UPI003D99F81B
MCFINNQRGSMTIMVLWLMVLTGVMLVIGVNFAKAYAVKEKASIGAEQASIAATDVIYDHVLTAVSDYDQSLIGIGHGVIKGKSIRHRIEDEQQKIMWGSSMNTSQALQVAVNRVMKEELPKNDILKDMVLEELDRAKDEIPSVVADTIVQNHGENSNYKIKMFDSQQRIVIESRAKFESVTDGNLFSRFTKKIPQVGKGPSIPFIENVDWPDQILSY